MSYSLLCLKSDINPSNTFKMLKPWHWWCYWAQAIEKYNFVFTNSNFNLNNCSCKWSVHDLKSCRLFLFKCCHAVSVSVSDTVTVGFSFYNTSSVIPWWWQHHVSSTWDHWIGSSYMNPSFFTVLSVNTLKPFHKYTSLIVLKVLQLLQTVQVHKDVMILSNPK